MESADVERNQVVPPPALQGAAGLILSIIGRRIGPYRVVARLGGGAMASVYRAVDERSGVAVALKVLLPDADATVRERFRMEARMVSTLDHPHIVRTLEVSHPDGGPATLPTGGDEMTYIAMELVDGENLGELLDRERALTGTDACALLAPIARALDYAHARSVVHRDVKPSNILLRRTEPGAQGSLRITVLDYPVVPLLSDFGIARALDAPDLTSAGRTIGTPAYMSPEQCAGTREIDGRADLYSLGAVLYRALVGRSPYVGTTTQILYSHVYDPVSVPAEVVRTLSPLLIGILRRALAKEPEDRYATAAEMAAELETCAGRPPLVDTAVAGQAQLAAEQFTLTMAELTAAKTPPSTVAAQVIVPAPVAPARPRQVGPAESMPLATVPVPVAIPPIKATVRQPMIPAYAPEPAAAGQSASGAAPRRGGLRWRGIVVGLSLAVPMFILLGLATAALLNAGPWRTQSPPAEPAAAVATAAPTAVAIDSGGQTSGAESTAVSGPQPAPSGVAQVTPTETPMPTPLPTPSGDINLYWGDAQEFFADRDWEPAQSWLTLVQRIDPEFEKERVTSMLVTIALQTGAERSKDGDYAGAIAEYERAVELDPGNTDAQSLLRTTTNLVEADAAGQAAARRDLQIAHVSYGASLVRRSLFCDASEQLDAGLALGSEAQAASYADEIRSQCEVLLQAQADQRVLSSLEGRLLYSTQVDGGTYRIDLVQAAPGAPSVNLIENGRQPALGPGGERVAFYSTRSDAQGLAGFDLDAGLDPGARSILFSRDEGDAADSPPGWNVQGSRLVFARTEANGRSRLFTLQADGKDQPAEIGKGQTPAWGWANDLIVYNGVDGDGANPGLYLMRPDGQGIVRLTDNGTDIRPAWSPDGAQVYFMSNGRSGNWDVYRVSLPAGEVLQLTDDPAQDGIPTVSPDGKSVAFVSDRGGTWNIWVVPSEGGKALLLVPVEGTLTNWLEHNLQWIP